MILLGSAVNGIAIVIGGLVGMFAGKLLPERIRTALVPTMSLVTIGIAVPGMMNTANLLIPILSMVIGTFIGELIDIDGALQKLSNKLQSKFKGSSVAEGFFTCSLVFAVGAVAVMGALDSGLKGDHNLLYAKALMDGKVKPEEQQEIFEIICRKSASMNDMVNTLFDYAKLGTEGYHADMIQLDLTALIRGIIAEHYTDFEEHGIELDIDLPDQPVLVSADKTELKRALTNLVVNVYKHNTEGIKASITLRKEQGKAIIEIADSGKPLPTDMDIFEPFVTENTARTGGQGTGLGLAITRRIIQRHGGEIHTEALDGAYTKAFVVKLTVAEMK